LRYEDLVISETPAAKEALSLASPDVVAGRMRRLKRASDLCFKQKTLQDYAPNMELEPFKMELTPDIAKIEARNEEYELLDLYKK
jgi:ubiquinol-cytochrome c reductase subunit 7